MKYRYVKLSSFKNYGYGESAGAPRKYPHEIYFVLDQENTNISLGMLHNYSFAKKCPEIHLWLKENMGNHRDNWVVLRNCSSIILGFKSKEDAIMFKMVWG